MKVKDSANDVMIKGVLYDHVFYMLYICCFNIRWMFFLIISFMFVCLSTEIHMSNQFYFMNTPKNTCHLKGD